MALDDKHSSNEFHTNCRSCTKNFCEFRSDDSASEPPLGWLAIRVGRYKPRKEPIYDDTVPIVGDTMDY